MMPGHMNRARSRRRRSRAAFLTMLVLICLALAIALFAVTTRTLLRERRLLDRQQVDLQAELLADAGLARAQARLATDRDYQGELWQPQLGSREDARNGQVAIEVVPLPDRPELRQITSVAKWQSRGLISQQSRQSTYQLSQVGEQP